MKKKKEAKAEHGPKWTSCVHKVKKKGSADNAYAVCTTSVGSQKEGGPGSGPHAMGKHVDKANKDLSNSASRLASAKSRILQLQQQHPHDFWSKQEYLDAGKELRSATSANNKAIRTAKGIVSSFKQSEGGAGSGPHGHGKTVDEAINKYNNAVKSKMAMKQKPSKKKEDDKSNIRSKFWFWASDVYANKSSPKSKTASGKDGEQEAKQILLKNPQINAATLLNTMKSQGLKVVDTKTEADGLSTGVAQTRAMNNKKESGEFKFSNARFLETTGPTGTSLDPTIFKVALIQEGLGNLKDAFYYSKKALESAVTEFEGKKCFADHPSRSEEIDRPERSVRDIVGHFENVHLEENDDGSSMLCADLVMLPEETNRWARSLVKHSIDYAKKYPDKNLIGLSINASGDADPVKIDQFLASDIPSSAKPKLMKAKEQGLTEVRVVSAIRDAVSTDLVTEPGAKGKVLEMLEKEKAMGKNGMPAVESEDEAMKQKKENDMEGKKEDGAGDEGHDDAAQDKALIMDMIKKHMGDGHGDMSDEECEAAHQAYEAHKEMGADDDKASEKAADAMKLAKHMAAKQAEAEDEGSADDDSAPPTSMAKSHEADTVIKLTARVSFLERELNKEKLSKYLDTKLAESKLGRAETDKLRNLIGTPKSTSEIDKTIKIFTEAYNAAPRGESNRSANIFLTSVEKQTPSNEGKGKFNFGECVKK